MIAVERRGRLGNQLFQFAFGVAASRLLSTDFVMADDELRRIFTLGGFSAPGRRAMRALRYRLRRTRSPFPVVKIDRAEEGNPEEVLRTLEDGTLYAGYFQSERFFAGAAAEVRSAFTLRPELEAAFHAKYAPLLERPYVCCHVRRTDYAEWLGGVVLPVSYYRDCLERVEPGEGVAVVFVGDDLSEVRAEFGAREGVRFEENAVGVDLQLVTHAETVVASNSSFAWWGAWLNATPEKRVLAPRHWLGFKEGHELPPSVIPPDWTQVPVR